MEELNALVLKLLDKYKEYRTILSEGFERPPVQRVIMFLITHWQM